VRPTAKVLPLSALSLNGARFGVFFSGVYRPRICLRFWTFFVRKFGQWDSKRPKCPRRYAIEKNESYAGSRSWPDAVPGLLKFEQSVYLSARKHLNRAEFVRLIAGQNTRLRRLLYA
jgi:hypothetical protein